MLLVCRHLEASIVFPGNSLTLSGMGEATIIDVPDLAPTTFHGIVMTGRASCIVRDLSIQTAAGGGDTVHCIFIEDGSDQFLIENVWIIESDANGIHIEGTDILSGRIHHCHIATCDEDGIHVSMDAANYMDYLTIALNDISGQGDDGIEFGFRVRDALVKINQINWNTGFGINISDATSVENVIENNKLTNNTAGAINDGGSDTATPEFNVTVENTSGNIGRHPVALMLDGVATTVRFGFTLPIGFQELVTAEVVLVPAANGALRWDALTDWGKICATEDYNTHSDAVGATTTAGLVGDDWECISVMGALDVAVLEAGDRVGLEFWRDATGGSGDTITGTVFVSELRGRYV